MKRKSPAGASGSTVRTLRVRVTPGARENLLEQGADGGWIARIKAPAREGRANAELIALVARHFGVARARVSIRHGLAGRQKIVQVEG